MTRQQLIRQLTSELESRGYVSIPGPASMGVRLLFKAADDHLFLTIGLEYSKLQSDGRLTASYYLSRTLDWGWIPHHAPTRMYDRLAGLLTQRERKLLLPSEYCEAGMKDGWWHPINEETITNFIHAVDLTEPRFVAQKGLRHALLQNKEIEDRVELYESIAATAATLKRQPVRLTNQPSAYPEMIEPSWFWAAELVLSSQGESVTMPWVKAAAINAWRHDFAQGIARRAGDDCPRPG